MTGTLKITGKLTAGSTLTASLGTFTDTNGIANLSYVWKSGTTVLSTNPSYILTAADLKSDISVTPVYNNTSGKPSANDGALHIFNHAHTGTIAINGSATVGNTLTVTNTLKDTDGLGTLHYIWARDGVSIPNNDKPTYKLLGTDLGKSITASVTYTDKSTVSYTETESKTTVPVTISNQTSAGNDVLSSTILLDKLTGGLGSDTFTFAYASTSGITDATRDVITDFNHSQGDVINLKGITALTGWSSTVNTPAAHKVWFDADTNMLYGSTTELTTADFSIQLTGVSVLETTDVAFYVAPSA
jgi:hypothetical protein